MTCLTWCRLTISSVHLICLIGLGLGVVHGIQQRDSYADAAALSTIGSLSGGEQHGEHSFSQDDVHEHRLSESYGAPQSSYGSSGQDSGYGVPEMKGWGMPEMKGWGMPEMKGWGMPETTTKGWGKPKSKSKAKKAPKSSGWGKPEMKGWGMPEMKGWGMPETTTKGWGQMVEGPSYKYKYKIIPHESEEEGWGWPEDDEKGKGKKKGLYGLFGLFGLLGILPWLLILLLAGLLLLPLPVITTPGGRQNLDTLFSIGQSKIFNSMDLRNIDLSSMQSILKAISKDYKSVYQNTNCIERWACTLTQLSKKFSNNSPSSSLDNFTKLIGASDINFVKRVKQGVAGAEKSCDYFKCDLISKMTKSKDKTKSS